MLSCIQLFLSIPLLMIFFLVMPGLFGGFGNYFMPIFLGAPEVVYPRINNISILILPLSYILIILSVTGEFNNGTGWTLYPPLSTSLVSLSPIGIDILLCGLLLSGISSCLTSINFIATIINMRCYSMTLSIMPVYAWSINITGFLLLLTLPILTGALIMSLADLHYNTVFFNPIFGGDPVLYQHLFWFFGHPEVYVLIIPAFGIISIIISGIAQIIIFGNQSMILAMSCICVLGSVVWGHHMYTVGMESDTRAYFTAVTMMISLPTGTKIFNWLCTYLNNAPCRTSAALFTLVFLLMFTIGGSTGVILGNAVVDIALHDTYYVVAHFHFVLSLGAVIAIFSGIMYFQEKMLGKPSSTSLNERYHFIMTFFGILLTFTPMHFLGFNVMPRRISDFPNYFNSWNYLSSIGSGITLICWFSLESDMKTKRTHLSYHRLTAICILLLTLYFYYNYLYYPLNAWFLNNIIHSNTLLLSNAALSLGCAFICEEAAVDGGNLTIISFILAWTFISLQIKEFRTLTFYINDSIFGSVFFFLTGLHFFHVIVGIILISIILCIFPLTVTRLPIYVLPFHLYYNLQLIYWHFIELLC